jgi:ankyrin repeat protein
MNRLEAAEILIDKGADLSLATSDNGGLTALHLASSRGHSEMILLLVKSMVLAATQSDVAASGDRSSSDIGGIERKNKKARV